MIAHLHLIVVHVVCWMGQYLHTVPLRAANIHPFRP